MRFSTICLMHLQRTQFAKRAMVSAESFFFSGFRNISPLRQDIADARVSRIAILSPTTKKLTLAVSKALAFHAGQWCALIITGLKKKDFPSLSRAEGQRRSCD
jgi:hypothetical protein